MNPRDSRIIDLMVKYVRREKLTVEEMRLLEEFWKQSPGHQRLAEEFGDEEWVKAQMADMEPAPVEEMWQEIDKYLDESGAPDDRKTNPIVLVQEEARGKAIIVGSGRRRRRLIWSAGIAATAAACLAGIWLVDHSRPSATAKPSWMASAAVSEAMVPDDDAVLLQGSDGSVTYMNSVPGSAIALRTETDFTQKVDDNQTAVCRLGENADLPGMQKAPAAKNLEWQTIYVGKNHAPYLLRLADGSTVWLKSGSYLRFPVGVTKKVEHYDLAGMGYFEVQKNHLRGMEVGLPGGSTVDVLGTIFNVDAGKPTAGNVVSLIEGSVSVRRGSESKKLVPGREAVLGPGKIVVREGPDSVTATAWLGDARLFHFDNTEFDSAIARVASWYRLKVAPHSAKGMAIDATVPMERTAEGVLQAIQEAGSNRAYVWLEGNVIYISDKPKGT